MPRLTLKYAEIAKALDCWVAKVGEKNIPTKIMRKIPNWKLHNRPTQDSIDQIDKISKRCDARTEAENIYKLVDRRPSKSSMISRRGRDSDTGDETPDDKNKTSKELIEDYLDPDSDMSTRTLLRSIIHSKDIDASYQEISRQNIDYSPTRSENWVSSKVNTTFSIRGMYTNDVTEILRCINLHLKEKKKPTIPQRDIDAIVEKFKTMDCLGEAPSRWNRFGAKSGPLRTM